MKFFDPLPHPPIMRALPVHPLTENALEKFIASVGCARRNPAEDLGFGGRTERFVTDHAASERANAASKIEALDYLSRLAAAVCLAQPVPMSDRGMFE